MRFWLAALAVLALLAGEARAQDPFSATQVGASPGTTACQTVVLVNQTASADLYTSVNTGHICAVSLSASATVTVSLVEGTGSTCGTGTAALIGGTSAAMTLTTAPFNAVAASPWLKMKTAADHLCLIQSGAGTVAGVITLADHS